MRWRDHVFLYMLPCIVQEELKQCLCKLEKGEIFTSLPQFFLVLPDNNVYLPAATAKSSSDSTAHTLSAIETTALPAESAFSSEDQSTKRQKVESEDGLKKRLHTGSTQVVSSKLLPKDLSFSLRKSPSVYEKCMVNPDKTKCGVASQKCPVRPSSYKGNKSTSKSKARMDQSSRFCGFPMLSLNENFIKEKEKEPSKKKDDSKKFVKETDKVDLDKVMTLSDEAYQTTSQLQDLGKSGVLKRIVEVAGNLGKSADLKGVVEVADKFVQTLAEDKDASSAPQPDGATTSFTTGSEAVGACCQEKTANKKTQDVCTGKEQSLENKTILKMVSQVQSEGWSDAEPRKDMLFIHSDGVSGDLTGISVLPSKVCHNKCVQFYSIGSLETKRDNEVRANYSAQHQASHNASPGLSDCQTCPEPFDHQISLEVSGHQSCLEKRDFNRDLEPPDHLTMLGLPDCGTYKELSDNKPCLSDNKISPDSLNCEKHSKILDHGTSREETCHKTLLELMGSRTHLEPSDQTASSNHECVVPAKNANLTACREPANHCIVQQQLPLGRKAVAPSIVSESCSPPGRVAVAVIGTSDLVSKDDFCHVNVCAETTDLSRFSAACSEQSLHYSHESEFLEQISHGDNDASGSASKDVSNAGKSSSSFPDGDVGNSGTNKGLELNALASVSLFPKMADGRERFVEAQDDRKCFSSEDIGHCNATHLNECAVPGESVSELDLEAEGTLEQLKKKQGSTPKMMTAEELETKIIDQTGAIATTASSVTVVPSPAASFHGAGLSAAGTKGVMGRDSAGNPTSPSTVQSATGLASMQHLGSAVPSDCVLIQHSSAVPSAGDISLTQLSHSAVPSADGVVLTQHSSAVSSGGGGVASTWHFHSVVPSVCGVAVTQHSQSAVPSADGAVLALHSSTVSSADGVALTQHYAEVPSADGVALESYSSPMRPSGGVALTHSQPPVPSAGGVALTQNSLSVVSSAEGVALTQHSQSPVPSASGAALTHAQSPVQPAVAVALTQHSQSPVPSASDAALTHAQSPVQPAVAVALTQHSQSPVPSASDAALTHAQSPVQPAVAVALTQHSQSPVPSASGAALTHAQSPVQPAVAVALTQHSQSPVPSASDAALTHAQSPVQPAVAVALTQHSQSPVPSASGAALTHAQSPVSSASGAALTHAQSPVPSASGAALTHAQSPVPSASAVALTQHQSVVPSAGAVALTQYSLSAVPCAGSVVLTEYSPSAAQSADRVPFTQHSPLVKSSAQASSDICAACVPTIMNSPAPLSMPVAAGTSIPAPSAVPKHPVLSETLATTSFSNLSGPLQPTNSAMVTTSINNASGVLQPTSSDTVSPFSRQIYLMVEAALIADYPLQALDPVWLQKTSWEQTRLLTAELQIQQALKPSAASQQLLGLAQSTAAAGEPFFLQLASTCASQLAFSSGMQSAWPLTSGPSLPSALVSTQSTHGVSVTDRLASADSCQQSDVPVMQAGVATSGEIWAVPPGFENTGILRQPSRNMQRLSHPDSLTPSVTTAPVAGEVSGTDHKNGQSQSTRRWDQPEPVNFKKTSPSTGLDDRGWSSTVNVFPTAPLQPLPPELSLCAGAFRLAKGESLADFPKQSDSTHIKSKKVSDNLEDFKTRAKKSKQDKDQLFPLKWKISGGREGKGNATLEVSLKGKQSKPPSKSLSVSSPSMDAKSNIPAYLLPTGAALNLSAMRGSLKFEAATGTAGIKETSENDSSLSLPRGLPPVVSSFVGGRVDASLSSSSLSSSESSHSYPSPLGAKRFNYFDISSAKVQGHVDGASLSGVRESLHISPASDGQGFYWLSPSQSEKSNSTSSCASLKSSADNTHGRKNTPCSGGGLVNVYVGETSVPQLDTFTFSKSLRRLPDASESDIELGYKLSSDSLATHSLSDAAAENPKDIKKPEKDNEWKTVWRKRKAEVAKKSKQQASDGQGAQSCHQKLMGFIMKTFPDLTLEQVNNITAEVKAEFGGHFHGQLFSDIIQKVKVVALGKYPRAVESMYLVKRRTFDKM